MIEARIALMLEVKNLSCPGLSGLSFTLAASETSCLSGPSGSGKTLLLRAVADLDVNAARIFLDGRERQQFAPAVWRRQVAYLPAESRWWAATVGEHFESPAHSLFEKLGFEAEVGGWLVERLSSGERQRLALLRVLTNKPRVLLLDEPTANLDASNIEKMESLLQDYIHENGAACLWVTHAPEQIRRLQASELRLEHGHLQTDGGMT